MRRRPRWRAGSTIPVALTRWDTSSAFLIQEAPGKPVNLQVYCRQGPAKLGKVKVVRSQFPAEFALEQRFFKPVTIESAAILGFHVTKIQGLQDPPTGTVVMVVKE
jgi:hypothetical protein